MEDAHSAVIGIPDQKENVSWFAGQHFLSLMFFTLFSILFFSFSFWFAGDHFLCLKFKFCLDISHLQCLTVMLEGHFLSLMF